MRRELILPADESAPVLARSALVDAIPPPVLNERADDARLAISEVAANAVMHGQLRPGHDTIRLVIDADDDHLRIEMEQSTAAVDVRVVEPRLEDAVRVGGFGLRLLDQIADDWGVEIGPPGHVWFEFRSRVEPAVASVVGSNGQGGKPA
jgi:anti-sigma regulatory factor (Ser/Thr protein kinase)